MIMIDPKLGKQVVPLLLRHQVEVQGVQEADVQRTQKNGVL